MSVMKNKMFLCGDYVNCYKCDQCGEKQVCSFQHWPHRNFTLCSNCLEAAYKDLFQLNLPKVSVKKKKPISVKIRLSIFKRDAYKCRYCGSDEDLEADHVIPESRGGETSLNNLVPPADLVTRRRRLERRKKRMKLIAIEE